MNKNMYLCPACNKVMLMPDNRNSLVECKNCLIGYDKLMTELYIINPTSYNEFSIKSPTIFN